MNDLTDAIRDLATRNRRSPALIVQTPNGTYLISPDGTGEGPENHYLISRQQLAELMQIHHIRADHLTDFQTAAELTTAVITFCQRPRD